MKWYLWGNTEQRPRCGVDTSSIAAKLLAMSPERREHTLRLPIYLEESGLTGDLHRLLSASVERSTAAVKSVQGISRLIGNDRKAQFEQIPVDNLWYGLWRDAGNVGGFV